MSAIPKPVSKALVRVTGLRAIRLAHGLKQIDVAKAAGVCGELISRWERRPPPLWGRLVRIADVLSVSTDAVLGREPATPVVDALAREDRELLDAMQRDAIALIGPEMLARVGGWRRIARESWLGLLMGARDRLLRLPAAAESNTVTAQSPQPTFPGGRFFPVDWFKGWESPRQKARRLRLPEPAPVRHLTAKQAAAKRRLLLKGAP